MRCGPFLVMLALLLGAAPALAQDSPGIIPMPKQPDAKPAKKHVKRKAIAAKAKPAETKPAEAKAVSAQTCRCKARRRRPSQQSRPRRKPPPPKPSRRPTCSREFRRASA